MRVAQMLSSEVVLPNLRASDKQAALAELVSALAAARGVDAEASLRDIAACERTGLTLLASGRYRVAVPHALTSACKQLLMAVGTSRKGIPWGAGVAERAHLIVVLLGPPQTRALYLRVLSRVARLCRSDPFLEAVVGADSSSALLERIAAAEEPLGEIPPGEGLLRFCVAGAGHGGMAMAGHLALTGFKVNLFNRSPERLVSVRVRGGIDVTGEVTGFAALGRITCDPAKALRDTDIVMVVVPATGHRTMGELLAPHLRDGQIVILNPGRTGGALEMAQVVRRLNPTVQVYLGEAQTLLYACRVTNPGQVHIFSIKNSVPLAMLPAYQVADVLPVIRQALPQFVPGDNVLKTSLDNIGSVFHPAITVLNSARIGDTHGDFEYYVEGVTPSVASVLEAVDAERVAVAAALGIHAMTARQWLYLAYDAAGGTLLEAMRANPGYRGIQAPGTLQHRYLSEDVPASLVPIASIGRMLGVPMPTIEAVIRLASVMHGVDYWAEGRTVERLGIKGMSVKDIRFLVVGAESAPAAAPAPTEA